MTAIDKLPVPVNFNLPPNPPPPDPRLATLTTKINELVDAVNALTQGP